MEPMESFEVVVRVHQRVTGEYLDLVRRTEDPKEADRLWGAYRAREGAVLGALGWTPEEFERALWVGLAQETDFLVRGREEGPPSGQGFPVGPIPVGGIAQLRRADP